MTDVVLVHPGAQSIIYGPLSDDLTAIEPPTWARMVAGWLRDRGRSVAIIDQDAEKISAQQVAIRVAALKPKIAAIIVSGHQPSASTQQMVGASAIAGALASVDGVTTLMVGNHPSAMPERTLMEEPVHYVCDGEGPLTIDGLLNGDAPEDIPGLVWRTLGIVHNAPAPLIAIDQLHGDVWDLLPMEKYRAHQWQCFGDLSARQPYASVYTTLGCPFKCSFCMINVFQHANRYRRRDPALVVAQIDRLYREYGVRTLKFADEMFILADAHVTAICEGLAAKPYAADLNIWAYARVDTVKAGQLPLLRKAGIRWLALGIESASAHVRDGADKALKTEDIVGTVRAIQAADINVIGNFIFGLPDDTLESMRETLALALELKCEFANFYSAMPYPGSRLFAETPPSDLPQSWTGYSQHSFDTTPLPTATLTAADVLRFRDDAFHAYFADPGYLAFVERKFGAETRAHVEAMASKRLPRKLLAA